MFLAVRYALFAVFSALVNFAVQEATMRLSAPFAMPVAPLALALVAGTAAGFVVKYLLDKHFIFFDRSMTRREEVGKVGLYGALSLATTAVFWGTEIAFWLAFGTVEAKYLGGAIGLAAGYAVKYTLDRRFVFRSAA